MKVYIILLFVFLISYQQVDALEGGLRNNNDEAPRITTEKIPCKGDCTTTITTTEVETKEPLKGPFAGKVEYPAKSNNLNSNSLAKELGNLFKKNLTADFIEFFLIQ